MKIKQKPVLLIVLFFTIVLGTAGKPLNVYAAEATVTFGSNWYNKKSGDTFPVGVYLKAKAAIGDYHIEIKYDSLRLEYVDGADDADEENGVLILEGNQNVRQIKFWIRFKAISGGEAFVEISSAEAALRNSGDGELFTITEYDSAPVHIKGTDTAAVIEERLAREAEEESGEAAGEEDADRDNREQRADGNEEDGIGQQGADGNAGGDGIDQQGTDGNAGGDGIGQQGVDEVTGGDRTDQQGTGEATFRDGLGEQGTDENSGGDGIDQQDADGSVGGDGLEQNVNEIAGEGGTGIGDFQDKIKQEKKNYIFFNVYFVMILGAVLVVVIVDAAAWSIIKRVRARRRKIEESRNEFSESEEEEQDDLELIDLDLDEQEEEKVLKDKNKKNQIGLIMCDEELEWQFGRPIIRICDVTMEFKMSSVNPSGLKEYIVQLLKREVSYRRLYALYHVSFNVYKGEVVGIIGTNGSGKSTLLKIVSGALKPTGGSVKIVGRRKVQLLTLGTGFDMELTARENVFLNGSIIGYRKEFLEEHYDEIVEFAELQDFMEEKVKNFSSGMVSRLGFAIATAGEAAEILILDEILSVGDEFFRAKSLKRIKEMIHGGSTVLMVSHSMGTILENCTRCVWIEKGELKMVGEPKVVCEEYRRLNG